MFQVAAEEEAGVPKLVYISCSVQSKYSSSILNLPCVCFISLGLGIGAGDVKGGRTKHPIIQPAKEACTWSKCIGATW